jgi:dTDP-glucose pyrophosphorylase
MERAAREDSDVAEDFTISAAATGGMKKAIILARGLGKRMRTPDSSVVLAGEQAQAADTGMKAMIPMGRPFLDYVLSALADSGMSQACLIIGPEHTAIREYYQSLSPRRIEISFATQEHPIGTANALLAARSFTDNESFMVLNSDNYYPVEVFHALHVLGEPGLPAFELESLVREGNISRERVRQYAILQIDASGFLKRIVEKPTEMPGAPTGSEIHVSMNCWRFDSSIFRACELVPRSSRGEFELPEAVQLGIASLGLRFKTVAFRTAVLDLSHRSDIASVTQRLAGIQVDL